MRKEEGEGRSKFETQVQAKLACGDFLDGEGDDAVEFARARSAAAVSERFLGCGGIKPLGLAEFFGRRLRFADFQQIRGHFNFHAF